MAAAGGVAISISFLCLQTKIFHHRGTNPVTSPPLEQSKLIICVIDVYFVMRSLCLFVCLLYLINNRIIDTWPTCIESALSASK
jgi:hypothetical protein